MRIAYLVAISIALLAGAFAVPLAGTSSGADAPATGAVVSGVRSAGEVAAPPPMFDEPTRAAAELSGQPQSAEPAVSPPPAHNQPDGPAVVVCVRVANVRAGPGLHYRILGTLRAGEVRSVLSRHASGDWWQIQYGRRAAWISTTVVATSDDLDVIRVVTSPPTLAGTMPGAAGIGTTGPVPSVRTPTPTLSVATPLPTSQATLPAVAESVVLGGDKNYPVRAHRFVGWGYEIVDGSRSWDIVLNRDVYGLMAHAFWSDTLYRRHQQGIRITVIDAVTPPECGNSVYPEYSPVLAPIQLANWGSGCKDRSLPLGFGDGEGASIAVGCTRDKPGAAISVPADPEECFIAIRSPGAHLNDIVVTGTVVGYNLVLNTFGTETPDLAQAPFTPALGKAYKEGDQWRWNDPFLRIVPSAK